MSITIGYRPKFIKMYKDLQYELKEETKKAIDAFKDPKNHKQLKVHKLHGKMNGRYSFSVNYSYRIVFEYESKNVVALLTIGDHDVYK